MATPNTPTDDLIHTLLGGRDIEFNALAAEIAAAGIVPDVTSALEQIRHMARRGKLAGRTEDNHIIISRYHRVGF